MRKMPSTPFSTRLSGSPRKLELRLRSIFQWKKKRPPVVLLALAVAAALFCGGLIGFRSVPQDNAAGSVPAEPDDVAVSSHPITTVDDVADATQTKTENESLEDASPAEPTEPYVVEVTTLDETVYPAIRYEGDGWHIDIPEGWNYHEAWNRWDLPDTDVYIQVQLCTGSMEYIKAYYAQLGAWRYDTDMKAPYDYYYLLDPQGVSSSGLHREAFFVPLTEDTCYAIYCTWVKDGKTAEELELLHAIAASFTMDGTAPVEVAQTQLLRRASFEGTRFCFDGAEYDTADINETVNAIDDCYGAGERIVVACHAEPQNNVYLIFDTNTGTFEKELIGANLVWCGDDISTAVYSFWNDIYDYEGNVLYTVSMEETSYIHALAFADDHSAIMVVIRNQADDTARAEFIEIGS